MGASHHKGHKEKTLLLQDFDTLPITEFYDKGVITHEVGIMKVPGGYIVYYYDHNKYKYRRPTGDGLTLETQSEKYYALGLRPYTAAYARIKAWKLIRTITK